jgi:hypothetical protein
MKWEYQIIDLAPDVGKDEAARRLCFVGKQGWEVVGVTSNAGTDRVYLKRQVASK